MQIVTELMNLTVESKSTLSPMDRVYLSRKADRPKALDIIQYLTTSFEELHGDRVGGDDPAVICGVGVIEGVRTVIIAQQKGSDTKERMERNFGMMSPSGYRKAARMFSLAERFSLPVFTIVDTPGAFAAMEAERNGISVAIAQNLATMSTLQTPILSLILGEGCSGGALGIAVADRVLMMRHAYYSVIAPEGCAAILWKDAREKEKAAKQLRFLSEDLVKFSMVERIVEEGENGFTMADTNVLEQIKKEVLSSLHELCSTPLEELLLKRYKKYRSI